MLFSLLEFAGLNKHVYINIKKTKIKKHGTARWGDRAGGGHSAMHFFSTPKKWVNFSLLSGVALGHLRKQNIFFFIIFFVKWLISLHLFWQVPKLVQIVILEYFKSSYMVPKMSLEN